MKRNQHRDFFIKTLTRRNEYATIGLTKVKKGVFMKGKRFKRFLCALGSVSILSLFGACETILDVNNRFTYTLLEDGTYEVSLNTKVSGLDIAEDFILENVTKIVIPDEYKGIPVTSIGERAFLYCENLKSVKLNLKLFLKNLKI